MGAAVMWRCAHWSGACVASSTGYCLATVAAIVAAVAAVLALPTMFGGGASAQDTALEDIYVLRSIREQQSPAPGWCASSKTGFEPFAKDAERFFSFWSVRSQSGDGKVVDAHDKRVAELRGCFGATDNRARQNFYAEIELGPISFRGKGECLALMIDFPETGLFPVRCHLILSDLPAPYVGGLLTTNTVTSKAAYGGDTVPAGYTQASIATIRLWKARARAASR